MFASVPNTFNLYSIRTGISLEGCWRLYIDTLGLIPNCVSSTDSVTILNFGERLAIKLIENKSGFLWKLSENIGNKSGLA